MLTDVNESGAAATSGVASQSDGKTKTKTGKPPLWGLPKRKTGPVLGSQASGTYADSETHSRTDGEGDGYFLRQWFSARGFSSHRSNYTSKSDASSGSRLVPGIRQMDSLHKHRTHSYYAKWFKLPRAIHVWDQEQHPHMTHWSDLFFDLIYVVVAFKSGNLLSVKQDDGSYSLNVEAFGLFVCVLLILYGGWESRLHLRSRLRLTDKFHRAILIFKGLTVAYATHTLPDKDVLNGDAYAAQFSATMVLHSAINVYLWMESYVLSREEKTKKNSLRLAGIYLISLVCIVLSLVFSLIQVDFVVVYVLWGLSYLLPRVVKDILALSGVSNRSNSIPVHYAYVIQRQGEWTMLVLGEGILQIIISPATDSVSYFAVFVLSYLILALLQLLHYSVLPFDIHDHVIQESTTRYTVLENVQVLYSIGLVVVGVALKLGLKTKAPSQEPLLCISISITVFMLFVKHLLHLGITNELGRISLSRSKRKIRDREKGRPKCGCGWNLVLVREKGDEYSSVWIGKFGLPLLVLVVPTFNLSTVYVNLLVFLWLVIIIAFQAFTGAFKRQRQRRVKAAFVIIKAVIKFKRLLANKRKREAAKLPGHQDAGSNKQVRFGNHTVKPEPLNPRTKSQTIETENEPEEAAIEECKDGRKDSEGDDKKEITNEFGDEESNEKDLGEVEQHQAQTEGSAPESEDASSKQKSLKFDLEANVADTSGGDTSQSTAVTDDETSANKRGSRGSSEGENQVRVRRATSSTSRGSVSAAVSEKLSGARRFGARLSEVVKGLNLYERPMNSLDWNELDRSHETVWGNLFFDLIYVAVLFQLGRILTQEGPKSEEGPNVWIFLAMFFSFFDLWEKKLLYAATFASSDLTHKCIEIIEGCSVALLAKSISSLIDSGGSSFPVLSRFDFMNLFASLKIFVLLIFLYRYVEVWKLSRKVNVKLWGRRKAGYLSVQIVIVAVSLVVVNTLRVDEYTLLLITSTIWMSSYWTAHILTAYHIIRRQVDARNSTPIHVEYYVHRYGEWVNLILGEGIIQFILAPAVSDPTHVGIFILAYYIYVAIRRCYFFVERFDASQHNQNEILFVWGIAWRTSVPLLSGTTLLIGLGLEQILAPHMTSEVIRPTVLLCASVSCFLLFLWLNDFAHTGRAELILMNTNEKAKRAGIIFTKVLFTGFPLSIPYMGMDSIPELIIVMVTIYLAVPVHSLHVKHRQQQMLEFQRSYDAMHADVHEPA